MKWDRTVTPYELRKYMEFCGQFHVAANLLTYLLTYYMDQSTS